MPEFREIARMATRLVLDSGPSVSPADTIARLAEATSRGIVLADLAWTRLTRWRENLSRVFENRDTLARLGEIDSIQVTYGEGYATAAWYFAAWVSNALADARVQAKVSVAPGAPTLRLQLGGGLRVTLSREEDRLVTTVNDQSNCTHLPLISDYLLMSEELGIVNADAVFKRTLVSAAQLSAAPAESK
jgi:glucose-6-phosphate dehydrogenase assembly protein OpcA